MLIGTGIGGGLVRKGKILRGAREVAGELGHLILDVNAILEERGPVCGCGFRNHIAAQKIAVMVEAIIGSIGYHHFSRRNFLWQMDARA